MTQHRVSLFRQIEHLSVGSEHRKWPLLALVGERVLLYFAICVFCGVANFGSTAQSGTLESNTANFLSSAIILSSISCLLLLNRKSVAALAPHAMLVWLFVALAVASTFWSVEPAITIRRLGTMSTAIFVATYMASQYNMTKCIEITGHAFLLVVVVSIIVALAFPSAGVMSGAIGEGAELNGTWKGLFANKNAFGWITIAGAQVYAWRLMHERGNRRLNFAFLSIFIFAAIKTQSATALVSIFCSLVLVVALRVRRWNGLRRVFLEGTFLILLVAVTSFLSMDFSGILGFLGKDPTLTGRIPLWDSLLDSIAQRPWLGYGYNAFWLQTNPEMLRIWALNPWKPPEAHNAYIDMSLELGIPGSVVATLILVSVLLRSLGLCRKPEIQWPSYIAMYSIVFVITNMVETRLFRAGDIHCFLLTLCYLAIARFSASRREVVLNRRWGHANTQKNDVVTSERLNLHSQSPRFRSKRYPNTRKPVIGKPK